MIEKFYPTINLTYNLSGQTGLHPGYILNTLPLNVAEFESLRRE